MELLDYWRSQQGLARSGAATGVKYESWQQALAYSPSPANPSPSPLQLSEALASRIQQEETWV